MQIKFVKKTVMAAVIISAFASSSYAATAITGSNTGTITLSGQLAAATCTVSLNKTAVNFGNIAGNTLKGLSADAAVPSSKIDVQYSFADCPAGSIKFALNANKKIAGSVNKGGLTVAGTDTTALYYRVKKASTTLNLDNTTPAGNIFAVTGAANTVKTIPLSFELVRGTGSVSGLTGALAGSVNYTVSYQ
ncbi:hypothetical protein [Hafnia paralvei]|uniref:hypothetical protein n=1 Tax=Hafnia paralvei TaxID=546367 RepID=UPI0010331F22|nr:hypothetical protein [Hafnia paralvei]TBL64319.1 hypothetical protein EYY97_04220 [Hafnia paralvei]